MYQIIPASLYPKLVKSMPGMVVKSILCKTNSSLVSPGRTYRIADMATFEKAPTMFYLVPTSGKSGLPVWVRKEQIVNVRLYVEQPTPAPLPSASWLEYQLRHDDRLMMKG